MTARERYRAQVAEALTGWRLGVIPPRPNTGPETAILQSALAEILELRLRIAYNPIFKTLQRMENQLAILARVREDIYVPLRPGEQVRHYGVRDVRQHR